MKLTHLACLIALALAACGGDDTSVDVPDADPSAPDAAACTGAAYDNCVDTAGSTDCMPGLECRLFMSQGFTACTPSCDADNPCPDQDGTAVACNQMGRCRAEAASSCVVP